jgi:putative flippase GtrA
MLAFARAEARQFLRFALVGATGFLIDAGLLALLVHTLGLDPYSSRVVSMSASAFTTWRLNRVLTFGASSTGQAAEGLRYGMIAALAAVINYGVYAGLLVISNLPPLAAVVIATGVAMGFSYLGYSRFAFQGARATAGAPSSQRR